MPPAKSSKKAAKKAAKASKKAAPKGKKAARAAPAKARKAAKAAPRPAAGKAAQAAAAPRTVCIALDPFGDPCQNTPRLGSKYCGVHSHLG
jgi:hypothetical protein